MTNLQVIGSDGANVNTGVNNGIIRKFEESFNKK